MAAIVASAVADGGNNPAAIDGFVVGLDVVSPAGERVDSGDGIAVDLVQEV